MDDMKYTDALAKLYEVMAGRKDILGVKYNHKDNSFSVETTSGRHICFENEFKNMQKQEKTNNANTVKIIQKLYDAEYAEYIKILDEKTAAETKNRNPDILYKDALMNEQIIRLCEKELSELTIVLKTYNSILNSIL